jgi:hypothetical protein
MLDWILNPFGVSLGAYVVLWIGLLVCLVIGVIAGIVSLIRDRNRR